jgi:hypothetical protein
MNFPSPEWMRAPVKPHRNQRHAISEQVARDILARQLSAGNKKREALVRRLPLFEVALNGVEGLR